MTRRTLVIVNPQSGSGATRRRWPGVARTLRSVIADFEVEQTRGPRDAERIAREGVRAGVERLIVAGGDGTAGEVATGVLAAQLGEAVEIGLLPLGTGHDLQRGLGLPRQLPEAIELLVKGVPQLVDAIRVEYTRDDGARRTAYCLNVVSFGISGLVNELVNDTGKLFGGKGSFLIGALRAILHYRSEHVTIRVDGEPFFDGPLVLAAGANGPWFGGGMHVAPGARVDDGLLDLVIVRHLSKPMLLRKLVKIYRGTHLADLAVTARRGRVVDAEAPGGRVTIDLDGEPLGRLPARCTLLPSALRVIGPRP